MQQLFSSTQLETLRAVWNRLIPADEQYPGALENGIENYLERQFNGQLQDQLPIYRNALDALETRAQKETEQSFTSLDANRADELLRAIESSAGDNSLRDWLRLAINHVAEGFYSDQSNGGNPEHLSWQMTGFVRNSEPSTSPDTLQFWTQTSPQVLADDYDVILIGAGAGGGVAACVLSEAGKRVLVLERGRDLSFDDIHHDHLRSQRMSLYGHNAGPSDEHPRVAEDDKSTYTALPWQGGYSNNAACVGGGTRVYGAQAWRFMAQDFRMASHYGVPDGSSLADWPLSYADLAPFYERIENELGVCGDGARMTGHTQRRADYPMPPLSPTVKTRFLQGGADKLNWPTFPVPLAINSVPYGGRGACIRCTECVGFACPTAAKAGAHNTFLPRAMRAGATLITGAMVARIECDSGGKAIGVEWLQREGENWQRVTTRARIILCASGAIETARLLLNSATPQEPNGLGNAHDNVGRNLQGHLYAGAWGVSEERVNNNEGPGVSISTNRWSHDNPGIIGGGMLADDFLKPPIEFWRSALPPEVSRWGLENKKWMRDNYQRTLQVAGPIQEIPNPAARVRIDPKVRDAWGIPVAHLSGVVHAASVEAADFLRHRAEEWLRASGCHRVWSYAPGAYLSGGQHQAGTCRMSERARDGVCDKFGRVHGHDNVFLVDGSVHVTNGGFNPFLTIMSLSARCAENIVADW